MTLDFNFPTIQGIVKKSLSLLNQGWDFLNQDPSQPQGPSQWMLVKTKGYTHTHTQTLSLSLFSPLFFRHWGWIFRRGSMRDATTLGQNLHLFLTLLLLSTILSHSLAIEWSKLREKQPWLVFWLAGNTGRRLEWLLGTTDSACYPPPHERKW